MVRAYRDKPLQYLSVSTFASTAISLALSLSGVDFYLLIIKIIKKAIAYKRRSLLIKIVIEYYSNNPSSSAEG